MRYRNGGAFRRALEDRLRERSLEANLPLVRLRKMVVFDRLLARIMVAQSDQWILKGGFALQLRLGGRARTTKDIDLLFLEEDSTVPDSLMMAASLEIGDWFSFEISRPSNRMERNEGGIRHTVHALLDGRTFERFQLDVGVGDPVIEAVDYLATPALLSFAEIEPVIVPCYPVSQQLAEKLHAYTKAYASGRSSRVKDFADILLLAEMGQISGTLLSRAIEATFQSVGIQDVPTSLPPPPRNWASGFKRMAAEVGLPKSDLDSAYSLIRDFFDPVLAGETLEAIWQPDKWSWDK